MGEMLSYVRYVPQCTRQRIHNQTWSLQMSVYVLSHMFGFFTALNSIMYFNNNFRPIKIERVF